MKIRTEQEILAAIKQLKKCAFEHSDEELEDGQVCTSLICEDVAEYLEYKLEQEKN